MILSTICVHVLEITGDSQESTIIIIMAAAAMSIVFHKGMHRTNLGLISLMRYEELEGREEDDWAARLARE